MAYVLYGKFIHEFSAYVILGMICFSCSPNSPVLQFYDSDRRFPAWGFGAKIPQGFISHCFNLNATTNDCEVVGVDGIMSAYSSTLYSVALAGPTLFGPVVTKAAEIANHAVQYSNNKYFVLLIITDGVITDVQETKDAIVRASDLLLSILIVGVGAADFTQMRVVGVDGIMSAYSSTLYSVALAGPTLFGPVVTKAAEIANHAVQYSNNKYFVLLIITDGVITDVQETKDAIVRASDLPLSILIVGVGAADFTQMRILDADFGKRLESSTGRIATRDIVQFVPVQEVEGQHLHL
ncbi:protein BONZAI 1-like [Lolium rigidum]|uniref:protein BONZAI 1-like n=1 Tax=Lolium rigidum TaxID=89674 RepID=UPI001F5DE418|nr:protein BONZAI 1-like [Lolium rigidum]